MDSLTPSPESGTTGTSGRRRRLIPGQGGFTLIEIMVVLAILGILATLVVPEFLDQADKAKVTKTTNQMKNIEQALQMYKLDNGVYPGTEQGLEALISKPTIGVIPKKYKKGGYMRKMPTDGWDNEFLYLSPGTGDAPYDLISYGADGEEGGDDYAADINAADIG